MGKLSDVMDKMRHPNPSITLQEGEQLIGSVMVSYTHKVWFSNPRSVPLGILDITDRRVVFTENGSSTEYNFELPKEKISSVKKCGIGQLYLTPMGVGICTVDGKMYRMGTSYRKDLLEYLEQMGFPQ